MIIRTLLQVHPATVRLEPLSLQPITGLVYVQFLYDPLTMALFHALDAREL